MGLQAFRMCSQHPTWVITPVKPMESVVYLLNEPYTSYLSRPLSREFVVKDMGIGIREWGIDFMDRPLILTLVHVYTLCTLLLLR